MAENQEEGFLHIGDKVILFEDDANGYLGSSGFSTTQLGVRPRGDQDFLKFGVGESVFQIRQQQNYSVTKQMRAFLEREGMTEQEAATDGRYLRLLQARGCPLLWSCARGSPPPGLG